MHTLGTEAIRAFLPCNVAGSIMKKSIWNKAVQIVARQRLIWFTIPTRISRNICWNLLKSIAVIRRDVTICSTWIFPKDYEDFLHILENEVNFYARLHHDVSRERCFEEIESIFERHYAMAY